MTDDPRLRFRQALERRDADEAVALARALAPLSLLDALALLDLLVEVGDPRFAPWARRWGERLAAERRLQPAAARRMWQWLERMPQQDGARAVTLALGGLVRGERSDG
ncbi:MAG: hypothetical protein JWQ48_2746 [Conexibacter sp.]|nr:hypothetical protein [Conexibacter sp.]